MDKSRETAAGTLWHGHISCSKAELGLQQIAAMQNATCFGRQLDVARAWQCCAVLLSKYAAQEVLLRVCAAPMHSRKSYRGPPGDINHAIALHIQYIGGLMCKELWTIVKRLRLVGEAEAVEKPL